MGQRAQGIATDYFGGGLSRHCGFNKYPCQPPGTYKNVPHRWLTQ